MCVCVCVCACVCVCVYGHEKETLVLLPELEVGAIHFGTGFPANMHLCLLGWPKAGKLQCILSFTVKCV